MKFRCQFSINLVNKLYAFPHHTYHPVPSHEWARGEIKQEPVFLNERTGSPFQCHFLPEGKRLNGTASRWGLQTLLITSQKSKPIFRALWNKQPHPTV